MIHENSPSTYSRVVCSSVVFFYVTVANWLIPFTHISQYESSQGGQWFPRSHLGSSNAKIADVAEAHRSGICAACARVLQLAQELCLGLADEISGYC